MKVLFTNIITSLAVLTTVANLLAESAATVPVGAVTVNIAAGTGTSKVRSAISIPLLGSEMISGAQSGRITGVTANSISSIGSSWSPGTLSSTSQPFLVRITSGQAEGATFLISSQTANTSDTLTIDSGEASLVNVASLGIVTGPTTGDTFQIIPCDTLSSFFGTPETTGVLSGPAAASADTLVITDTYGLSRTFYYNSSLNRWARQTLGNPDATNFPIRPDSGIQYFRLGNSAISLTVMGTVPSTNRLALVKNAGVSILSNSWPVSQTLLASGIQNIPGWVSGSTAAAADIVLIGYSNYFFDGTNWRQQTLGSPIKNPLIEVGTSVSLNKKGSASGASLLSQPMTYSLN